MANDIKPTIIAGSIRGPVDENGNAKVYTADNAEEMHGQFSDEHLQVLESAGIISGGFAPKQVTDVDLEADPTIRAGNAKDKRDRTRGPIEGKRFVSGQESGGDNVGNQ